MSPFHDDFQVSTAGFQLQKDQEGSPLMKVKMMLNGHHDYDNDGNSGGEADDSDKADTDDDGDKDNAV